MPKRWFCDRHGIVAEAPRDIPDHFAAGCDRRLITIDGPLASETASLIGRRVRALLPFNGVPRFSEGVVDEEYRGGVMVRWEDLPSYPENWRELRYFRPIRDGFAGDDETRWLEVVG